ncbi:MAG: hypothetical protein KF842_02930 [Caulobacter sp.]|nr:hypothetical protein [Caulobacter sp.]
MNRLLAGVIAAVGCLAAGWGASAQTLDDVRGLRVASDGPLNAAAFILDDGDTVVLTATVPTGAGASFDIDVDGDGKVGVKRDVYYGTLKPGVNCVTYRISETSWDGCGSYVSRSSYRENTSGKWRIMEWRVPRQELTTGDRVYFQVTFYSPATGSRQSARAHIDLEPRPLPPQVLRAIDDCLLVANATDTVSQAMVKQALAGCTTALESGRLTLDQVGSAHMLRADLYLNLNDSAAALADFLNVPTQSLDHSAGQVRAMLLLTDLGRHSEARRIAETLTTDSEPINRSIAESQLCWTTAVVFKEDLTAALDHCNRAVSNAPTNPGAYNGRGLVNLMLRRNQPAFDDFNQSLKIAPENSIAIYGMGVAAGRLGRADESAADIKQALAMDPKVEEIFREAGLIP